MKFHLRSCQAPSSRRLVKFKDAGFDFCSKMGKSLKSQYTRGNFDNRTNVVVFLSASEGLGGDCVVVAIVVVVAAALVVPGCGGGRAVRQGGDGGQEEGAEQDHFEEVHFVMRYGGRLRSVA